MTAAHLLYKQKEQDYQYSVLKATFSHFDSFPLWLNSIRGYWYLNLCSIFLIWGVKMFYRKSIDQMLISTIVSIFHSSSEYVPLVLLLKDKHNVCFFGHFKCLFLYYFLSYFYFSSFFRPPATSWWSPSPTSLTWLARPRPSPSRGTGSWLWRVRTATSWQVSVSLSPAGLSSNVGFTWSLISSVPRLWPWMCSHSRFHLLCAWLLHYFKGELTWWKTVNLTNFASSSFCLRSFERPPLLWNCVIMSLSSRQQSSLR